MNDTATLDPRLRKGLVVTVADLAGVYIDHYSYDGPRTAQSGSAPRRCPICPTTEVPCPSWRVAQPLLFHRRSEDHSVSIPVQLRDGLRKPWKPPAPPAPEPDFEDVELFDTAPYVVPKRRRRHV